MKELHAHVIYSVTGIHTIDQRTLRRLTKTPSAAWTTSHHYRGIIDAKVATRRNNVCKENIDAHYFAARVRYRLEFASQSEEETVVISSDCMNKVNIGTLAVSRYHQLNRIFPSNDAPDVPDHDFPLGSNYKITPSGYMHLVRKPAAPKVTTDKFLRSHFSVTRTGPSFIFNRVTSFRPVSIKSHVNYMVTVLDEVGPNEKVVVLVVDGGPDWSTKSLTVLLFMLRLFKERNLDVLCMTSYGPAQSTFNPIEHLWAPLSKRLASVSLPAILAGEEQPPSKHTGIGDEERSAKEAKVFDNAMTMLCLHWDGTSFDECAVRALTEKCGDQDQPWHEYASVHKELLNASKRSLKDQQPLVEELTFLMRHCDRRIGKVTFLTCLDPICSHCSSNAVQSNALKEIMRNGGMPTPVRDVNMDGPHGEEHFFTYLQAIQRLIQPPDNQLRLYHAKGLGRCKGRLSLPFRFKEGCITA